jgi:serine/threonine protein kinase/outer membrane protein assembly factor BamB
MTDFTICSKCGAPLANGVCSRCGAAKKVPSSTAGDLPSEEPTIVGDGDSPAIGAPFSGRAFGDYELLDEIARGGMGVVYRARQISLNRIVALKMILAGQLASEEDVERFRTEAEAAANLRHANIVSIYEVGEFEGQHYFSMDYIAGQNLADVVRDGPLPAKQAAQHAATVAHAIEYAHHRGILHRDLKPSNVLLDEHGVPQITDFGLAKQMGAESDITATGQALGTPSYMPPEQAAGRRDAMGPASDVYSIGALLYEMLVGHPPFQAETPFDTILQVIENDPPPPRLLNPNLPRDLDTIALKCLEKDPSQRYSTAGELADDLDRFLAGEPIQARPIGVVEQLFRRSRIHARTIRAVSVVVTGLVVLILCLVIGRSLYIQSRQGTVRFESTGESLRGEILDPDSRRELTSFSIPTSEPIRLLEGDYELRLSGPGQFSQSSLLSVERGSESTYHVDLSTKKMWQPIALGELDHIEVVEGGDADDLVILERRFGTSTLRRIHGGTGRALWSLTIHNDQTPELLLDEHQRLWRELNWATAPPSQRPMLLSPAPDLDGDGIQDLVWIWFQHADTPMVAQAGSDGSFLWFRTHEAAELDAMPLVAKLDGDDRDDLVLFLRDQSGARLETIRGHDGEPIWRPVDIPGLSPRLYSPIVQIVAGRTNAKFASQCRLVTIDNQIEVALVCQQRLFRVGGGALHKLVVDFGGEPVRPIEFIFPQAGDVVHALVVTAAKSADGTHRLQSFSIATGKSKWSVSFGNGRIPAVAGELLPNVPLVIDLNRDGRKEIVVPSDSNTSSLPLSVTVVDAVSGRPYWAKTLKLNLRGPAQVKRVLGLPDITGDGVRELVIVSVSQRSRHTSARAFFVDVLSGRNGATLSTWLKPFSDYVGNSRISGNFRSGRVFAGAELWEPDDQNVPKLIIASVGARQKQITVDVVSLTAARVTATTTGVSGFRLADFDGDGLGDVLLSRITPSGTRVEVVRGGPYTAWRRLGDFQSLGDFNRDGFAELTTGLLQASARVDVPIYSGKTGRRTGRWTIKWPFKEMLGRLDLVALPMPEGDIDKDGVADVLAAVQAGWRADSVKEIPFPLQLISGRTGKRLWLAEPVPLKEGVTGNLKARVLDIDGDGQLEVLVTHRVDMPLRREFSSRNQEYFQLRLVAFHARTGKLKWDASLSRDIHKNRGPSFMPVQLVAAGVDLNDDGLGDIVVTVGTAGQNNRPVCELVMISGSNGQKVWSHKLLMPFSQSNGQALPRAAIADLDADGRYEVVIRDRIPNEATSALKILSGDRGALIAQTEFPSKNFGATTRITVVHTKNGGRQILVPVPPDLVSLELLNGELIEKDRFPADPPQDYCVDDFNGDGIDEIYSIYNSKVIAHQGNKTLWGPLTLPSGAWRIDSQPTRSNTLVLHSLLGSAVLGVDPKNGSFVWRGQGQRLGDGAAGNRLPSVVSSIRQRLSSSSAQTASLPTDLGGSYTANDHREPVRFAVTVDPRTVEYLPWVPRGSGGVLAIEFSTFLPFLTGAFMGVMIYVIPGWWVWGGLIRKQWSLRRWLLLPLVVGIALTAVQSFATNTDVVRESGGGSPLPRALGFAAMGATMVLFPIQIGVLFIRRRFRVAGLLFAFSLVAAVVWGTLWVQLASKSLLPGQSFCWDGWYLIWFSGVYVAGFLGLIVMIARWIVQRLKRRRERLRATTQSPLPT